MLNQTKTTKFFICAISALILASAFIFPPEIAAQYKGLPVTKDRLMKVLQGKKLPQSEIIEVIVSSGVNFEATPDVEDELADAGARPAIIKAVRDNFRGAATVKNAKKDDWFEKGETLFQEEKWEQAAAAFKMSVQTQPSYQAYLNLGRSYLKLNQPRLALESLQASLKLNPNYALTWSRIGSAYSLLKNETDALEAGKKAVSLDSECDICWNNLGVSYMGLQNYEEAISAYKKAIQIAPSNMYFRNIAFAFEMKNNPDLAVEAYQMAIETKPDDYFAWAFLGNVYRRLRNFPEALKATQKAVQLNPNDVNTQFYLGLALLDMENYRFAIEAFEKAVRLDAGFANGWFQLGIALEKSGRLNEALEAYKQGNKLAPNAMALVSIGNLYYLQKNFPAAVESYQQSIRLNPNDSAPWFNLGNIYFNQGNYTAAAESYRQAVRIDPNNTNAQKMLIEAQKRIR